MLQQIFKLLSFFKNMGAEMSAASVSRVFDNFWQFLHRTSLDGVTNHKPLSFLTVVCCRPDQTLDAVSLNYQEEASERTFVTTV